MSLTLYFYKVPKGKKPNCRNKEWFVQRRMYNTFEMVSKNQSTTDVNNWTIYPLTEDNFNLLCEVVKNAHSFSYDDECELEGLKWLSKRKINFEKFDIFVLNA